MVVSKPELVGQVGAVSSTHWLASSAGMAVLEQGGNAFDAAAAAGFVLQVVEPHSNGLGGDVSIVVHEGASGVTKVVCGQGPTPRAATLDAFRSYGLNQIPGSGMLPACVPGAFGAWLRLLAEFGTLPLAPVMDASIGYAAGGYPLVPDAARAIAVLAPLFAAEWPESGRTYLVDGQAPEAGTKMRNLPLAETMQRILHEAEAASSDRETQIETARAAFYEGFVAETIDAYVRRTDVLDATGRRHRGLLTADDLAAWRAPVEQPAAMRYRDYSVYKPGPWSQGPVFLQQLAILDGMDLSAMPFGGGEYLHTVTEVAKLAMADREGWYGDPDRAPVPIEELLSSGYADTRRELLGQSAATSPQPGTPGGLRSWVPRPEPDLVDPAALDAEWMRQLQSGMPTIVLKATVKAGDTCTVVVADRYGNLAAAVPSGGWLKSSPVIPGLGFPLGTRGQTMWLVDGHPNSLGPGKRPRTTLSPTVVLRDGDPFLAFGTPGGDRQDQWTLETFLAITEFGYDLQEATEVTMFHTDHFPSSFTPRACRPGVVVLEDGGDPDAAEDLRRRGHEVDVVPAFSLGSKVCIAGVDSGRGFVRAAAGPRGRQAYASCR
ncbi:gamma-glutamyltransferase family protein [Kibdelosporangium persicum]|nr:gamma-glutamyltransferase family protein [Kibdelosporangium persicum]